jgi:hypothetical protein
MLSLRSIDINICTMKFRLTIALIILAAVSRLIPHPLNFTPIAAMGLFGAAYLPKRWMAFVVPFSALFLSDLVLNNGIYNAQSFQGAFTWVTSPWMYLSFAAVIGIGALLLRGQVSATRVALASLSASVVFFLVSNFWSWTAFETYPKTAAGLAACYTMALPFFVNTIAGDLFFSTLLFGIYAWSTRKAAVFA